MSIGRLTIGLFTLALSSWAQSSAGVSGPVTGFIFDTQRSAVRPMLGIPGAAYVGDIVAGGLRSASVSPDGSLALGIQAGGAVALYGGLRGTAQVIAAIPGAISAPDHFAWTTDNSAAAVYTSRIRQGQMLTGLGQSPAAGTPIDLSSLPGPVTALATDGQRMILGVSNSDAGGIFVASGSGVQRIASAGSPTAIALAGDSLFFADGQSQRIFQVQNYAGTPAAVVFASDSSIDSPAGLQVSADGQRLFVANGGNRKLAVYDIASSAPLQSLDLKFTPTRLDRFGDASVFLMNGVGQGPLYVMRDGGAGKAAVFFVPAPANPRPLRAPVRKAAN